jgi:two-component system sensor histidine kinase/response regulator
MALPIEPTPAPPGERVNVLLVDDQPPNLVALEAMLERLEQTLVPARSGREALKWLLTHDAAVILLDVAMPEMDGFETAALIRERERSRHTPIIFLTAAAQYQTEAVRGYALGAVDYLLKPVVPEFVRSKVSVFVELAKQRSLLARQADLLRAGEQAARELAEARAALVRDLEFKNRELESFSYAISHDLRAPLRRIESFAKALGETQGSVLDSRGGKYLGRIQESAIQMLQLIDDVLHLSRVTIAELRSRELDLSAMAQAIAERLRQDEPDRQVEVRVRPGISVTADPALLRVALENLLFNAWKFTSRAPTPVIEVGLLPGGDQPTYFVRDNGAGFEMAQADRLFRPFQRLHLASEYPGTGIGLATVRRIIHRHGGAIWAHSSPGQGACFYFTLNQPLAGAEVARPTSEDAAHEVGASNGPAWSPAVNEISTA